MGDVCDCDSQGIGHIRGAIGYLADQCRDHTRHGRFIGATVCTDGTFDGHGVVAVCLMPRLRDGEQRHAASLTQTQCTLRALVLENCLDRYRIDGMSCEHLGEPSVNLFESNLHRIAGSGSNAPAVQHVESTAMRRDDAVASDSGAGIDTKNAHEVGGAEGGARRLRQYKRLRGQVLAIHDKQDKHLAASRCQRVTLAAAAECSGLGIHTGRPARVRVEPAPFGEGISIAPWRRPTDRIACIASHAGAPGGATVLGTPRWQVSTIEHLLAALIGMGVTDARAIVDGPEMPALDGSARDWVALIADAGLVTGPAVGMVSPRESVCVRVGDGVAHWHPSGESRVEVRDGERSCSVQLWSDGSRAEFEREVCWARTFVRRTDIARLRAAGRGRGATWSNTIFLGGTSAPKLRGDHEPLRHKLLDLVGDLALIGTPWAGHVVVERGSHALHHALVLRVAELVHDHP